MDTNEIMRCWNLIKQTAVEKFDPLSKNDGLLFKNQTTGDFAFISKTDLEQIETALSPAPVSAEPVAWMSTERQNAILSAAQYKSCLPKNRAEYTIPLFTSPPNLAAENARLREALETLATSFHGSNPSDAMADMPREDYLAHILMEARRFARAALTGEKP